MFTSRTRSRVIAAAVTVAVTLGACGGDDTADEPDEPVGTVDAGAPGTAEPGTSEPVASDPASTDIATSSPSSDGGDGGGSAQCEATVPGSEVNFGVYSPAAALDPLQSSGSAAGGTDLAAIYDTLTRWNPETNDWEPQMAESFEPNEDYTEWTVTLREGLTYANGDPVLAEHILTNFERLLGPGRNSARAQIARLDLESSEVVDDRTVVIHSLKPWVTFGELLGEAPGMIVNPALGAEVDANDVSVISADPNGAGAGAYEVERWAPGESPYLVLKARDDYWGGPVCVETVNFIYIADDRAKLDSLELGELDFALFRTPDVIADARASGTEYTEISLLQSSGENLLINNGVGTHTEVTADVRFRQAVNLAIDPEIVSQQGFGGELLTWKGLVHESSPFYSGVVPPEPDADAARALVEELKAEGWDGSVRLLARDLNPNMNVAIVSQLEAVGMSIDLTVTDINTMASNVVGQDYDMAIWGLNIADSSALRSIYFNLRSDSPSNRMGFSNPEVDAAIDALYATPDADERREIMKTIDEIYNELSPSVPFGVSEELYLIRDTVAGVTATQMSVVLLDDLYRTS